MATSNTGRVVVRRKRAYSESHHGGSWKIAYADFVTAMMAFFLVMWLISLVPSNDLKAIAEYFRMPLMTAITGGPNMDVSKSVIPGGSPSIIPNKFPMPGIDLSQDRDDRLDMERLEDLKTELENLIESNPVLKEFRPQLLLDMTPDGLRIQILDKQSRPMFATGSAVIQPYMRDILRELAPMLSKMPNSLTISGHTDAIRYASGDRDYSNWELSADRANAARKALVAGSLVENKVKRVLGLADTVNLIKDNPVAAVNRRISLLVLNRRAERRIDEQNASGQDELRIRTRSTLLGENATLEQVPSPAPLTTDLPIMPTTPSTASAAPTTSEPTAVENAQAN
ncbi:flagellar motor protein MotB [Alcaligenaceae bacterium CGII-47]|nr:flagellar motor protein MotB [Alcaligenaceae bacterium CGII-47]